MIKLFAQGIFASLSAAVLVFGAASSVFAAGYTDGHSDGSLSGWATYGSRTWSEAGSRALPQDGSNYRGFAVNNYACASDGTFYVVLYADASYNNYNGGAVFRFTDTTSYYFLALYEQDYAGQNSSNAIRVFSNTTNWSDGNLLAMTNLNFSGLNHSYPIKVEMSGSSFTFYLNGTQIGTLTNSAHSGGKVGYAYHSQWNRYASFDSSAWTDGSGGGGGSGTTEDYATWSNSTSILLNTTSSGANVANNVLKFPVLIRLNPGNFGVFAQTLAGGADIRFAKTNGTHIPYQIERWTDNTGDNDTAEIWVKIDTVYGNNSTQSFLMYWGKTSAVDSSSGANVFVPANGFMADYHLAGNLNDATGNGNTGADYSTVDTGTGIIGKARAFNGSSQYFSPGDLADRASGTISFWFRPKATFNSSMYYSQGIWGKCDGASYSGTMSLRGSEYLLGDGSAGELQTKIEYNNTSAYISSSTAAFSAGIWYYVSWSWGGGTDSMYVNGAIEGAGTSSQTLSASSSDEVGRSYYDGDNITGGGSGPRYFNGTLDEFRLDNTIRGKYWVKLCYENQKASQSLLNWSTTGDFTWDSSTASGIQPAKGGTWGSNNYWTSTSGGGTGLVAWPGAGNSATFAGSDGSYTITLNGSQTADSISFLNTGYGIRNGTTLTTPKIYVASGKYDTIATVLGGSNGLTKSGGGYLVLSGSNTYTGATTINGGTIRFLTLANGGSSSSLGASSSGASNLVINGGSLEYTYSGIDASSDRLFTITTSNCSLNVSMAAVTFTNTGSIGLSGSGTRTFYVGGNGTGSLAAVIGDNGGATLLQKYGSGTWILTGANTYTGATIIVYGGIGTGTLQIGNGGTTGSISNSSNITNGCVLIVDRSDAYTYSGVISSTGSFTKKSAGVLTLSGNNTYSGSTTISGGTLQIGAGSTSGTISNSSAITNNATLVFNRSDALSYGGVISGTGAVANSGAGTTTLSGTNTYAGITTINAGAISCAALANGGVNSNIGASANTAANLVINGGTLTYTGSGASCDRLFTVGASGATIDASGTGALNLSNTGSVAYSGSTTHLLTLAGSYASATNTFAPAIGNDGANAVSLTKSGAGTWKLTGTNTYTGATTVGAGALHINGSTASGSAVTVSSGAILGGTGTINGNVTVNGTLSPCTTGTAAGTLTLTGNLTFTGGSTYGVIANGKTAGSLYDQTAATGASAVITLGSATLSFTLGYLPTFGDSFVIIDNQGANAVSGTFTGISDGGTIAVGYAGTNYNCIVNYDGGTGNDVVVTVVSISAAAAEDYSNWHYSKNIYINTKEGGANVAGDQQKFPLLVRLNSTNFDFSQALSTGYDLRFAKSNGDHLPYQIERWDNANSLAEIWVRIDTVRGYNNTQYFKMYWGKSDALDSSNGNTVFDTSNGFRAVWHLGEAANTTGSGYKDATINANNGTGYNMSAGTEVNAVVGKGQTFNGSNTHIDVTDAGSLNQFSTGLTLMIWLKTGSSAAPISRIGGVCTGYALLNTDSWYMGNGASWISVSSNLQKDSQWHQYTLHWNGSTITPYRDGTAYTGVAASGLMFSSPFNNKLSIGSHNNDWAYFSGAVDEITISSSPRSADWIKLCYETQKTDQTTVLFAEDFSQWTFSKNLYLNTKAGGANVSNAVMKFPVLVRLDSTNIDFTQVKDSGQDLRFSKSDGITPLFYEIEWWDNTTEAAAVWVLVDTVYGGDSTHYFKMYWGKSDASSMANPLGVFDSANGFRAVWHLKEDPTGGTGALKDATKHANNGTSTGTMISGDLVDAVIGKGIDFDGTNDAVTAPSAASFDITAAVTVSAWFKARALTAWTRIAVKSHTADVTPNSMYGLMLDDASHIRGELSLGGTKYLVNGNTALNTTDIFYGVFTYDGSTMKLYVNGTKETNTTSQAGTIATNTQVFSIGMAGYSTNYLNGIIDEVTVSRTARSADWIKLCYENQKPAQSLVMYTVEDYSQWAYSHKVNINTSQSGSGSSNLVQNFPALIRLTSTTFPFGQAQDDGRDVRFAKLDGTVLSYEIERWDRGNELAEIWVLLDSVKANNGTQFIKMYWGKSGVTSTSSGRSVFSASNGYSGVWHLGESGTTDTSRDASGNGIIATPYGAPSGVTGTIGKARSFGGTSDYLQLNTKLLYGLLGSGNKRATISFWFKPNTIAPSMMIWEGVNTANGWGGEQECHFSLGQNLDGVTVSSNYYGFYFGDGTNYPGGGTAFIEPTFAFSDLSNWHYAVNILNNTAGAVKDSLYLDGVLVAVSTSSATLAVSSWNTNTRFASPGATNRLYSGALDEIRIVNVNRSADAVKLNFENQKANQTLIDLDDYDEWSFSRSLYINTSGMSLSGNVVKFPLLVRLDTTLIDFNQARDTGQDLRFSKADGTHLRYEIEKWDKANKQAMAWVLVDTIKKSSSTQYIKMYWGKSDGINKSNANAVFDSSNGFRAVWHLKEDPTGGSGAVKDATIHANNGTSEGTMTSGDLVDAVIGKGIDFDGTNDAITAPSAASFNITAAVTVSAWFKARALTSFARIAAKSHTVDAAPNSMYALMLDGTSNIRGEMGVSAAKCPIHGIATLNTTDYFYGTFTYDGSLMNVYVNGVLDSSKSKTGALDVNSQVFSIGKAGYNMYYFNGIIDEVCVSRTARSADWIKLCYETQKLSQTAIVTDSSAELFLPMTVSTFGANQADSLDSCIIATKKWTVKFDRFKAGGIKWLSPDSLGAGTNQLDTNLFYLLTNNHRSDTGYGNLKLLDKGKVFTRLRQKKVVGGQLYSIVYTVLGSARIFVKVSTYASANLAPAGGMEFRIASSTGSANSANVWSSAASSGCKYILRSDAGANKIDACLALFENWSQADANTGSATSKYAGIKSSTWSLPANRSQAWEFMINFSHCNWDDTTGVGYRMSDYWTPDSMDFYTGTPLLERSWERQMSGHWQFEEGAGDTTFDNSVYNSYGIRPSGATWTWATGKWGRCISLSGGNDKVFVKDNAAFDHLIQNGFTICAWIKPTSTMSSSNGIFKKFNTGGYSLTGGSGGVVQLALNGSTFPGRTSVGSGAWHHVAAVYKNYYDHDTVTLYVDGKPDTIFSGANWTFDTSHADVYIGNAFSGLIDDVRFYGNELWDDEIKALYQLGYSAEMGIYVLRANNSNTVHAVIDGASYHRYFPTFQIYNYWSGNQPSATTPKVYVNGTLQTFEKDYFAVLDDNRNKLTVGFNSIINADAVRIYISSDDTLSPGITTTMPKMYWGSISTPSSHFYVKNFSGNTFGSATANQFYIDFKMGKTSASMGGEIFRLKTSKISPLGMADTSTTGNLISTDYSIGTMSSNNYKIGSTWLKSTYYVNATPTYAVAESSIVRVVFQLNPRTLKSGSDSCVVNTQLTLYPTGQIFRWDSVYVQSAANIDSARYDVFQAYVASGAGTVYTSLAGARGGVYGAANLQDFAAAFLTRRNSSGVVASSIDSVNPHNVSSPARIGPRFVDVHAWTSATKPHQSAYYWDIQQPTFTTAKIDSVSKGVQNSTGASTVRLAVNGNGSVVTTSAGDLNADAFNEKEGAYIYAADNANTAHFTLYANGDTCRFNPAFRITNYTAVSVPQYVFVNNVAKVKDFGFNAYVKRNENELVLQLWQKLCSNADIYISYDKTLAVTMTDFIADAGDAAVALHWNTQSEENNLGFFLYRRIRPAFLDSISRLGDSLIPLSLDTVSEISAPMLFKAKVIQAADTGWNQVNRRIIYGAMSGVSYGKRSYKWIDKQVYNNVQYEYKLTAVDFNNNTDVYDKFAAAHPRKILPVNYELWGNYPNPFRQMTYIKFDLPVKTRVALNVYNIQGRLIKQILRPGKPMVPGFYRVSWDGKNDVGRVMAAGPYIYRITAQGYAKSKIMILIK